MLVEMSPADDIDEQEGASRILRAQPVLTHNTPLRGQIVQRTANGSHLERQATDDVVIDRRDVPLPPLRLPGLRTALPEGSSQPNHADPAEACLQRDTVVAKSHPISRCIASEDEGCEYGHG